MMEFDEDARAQSGLVCADLLRAVVARDRIKPHSQSLALGPLACLVPQPGVIQQVVSARGCIVRALSSSCA